jgi:hypothetical protein
LSRGCIQGLLPALKQEYEWLKDPYSQCLQVVALNLSIELSVLDRQCFDRRIPDKRLLIQEISAWGNRRNSLSCKVNWQFTTADARSLYLSIIS